MELALIRGLRVSWRAACLGVLMITLTAAAAQGQERIPVKVGNRSGQDMFVVIYDHVCPREAYRGLLQGGGLVQREYCTAGNHRASISIQVPGSSRMHFNNVRANKIIWLRLTRHGVQQGR